ncbi:MAG: twin-arginine translocation pathway signal [Cyanobacteriota bacterium]
MATFSRRRLLTLSSGGALALLTGCRPVRGGTLLYSSGTLPQAWLNQLPRDWTARGLSGPQEVLTAPTADLMQLGDGWATTAPHDRFEILAATTAPLLGQLDPMAAPISRLLAPAGTPPRAFPWAFGTWVLLVRRRPDLIARASEGWSLLLDPSLRGRLVLPSSPRVVISLLAGNGPWTDPGLPDRLRRLRAQALAFDDVDGLNLLLANDAEAMVLPSQRAVPLLRRDPRLRAVLPAGGSPLIWSLLLRPAGASQPLPLAWMKNVLQEPLLSRLLAEGWVPPLPRATLLPLLRHQSPTIRSLLLPETAVLHQCPTLAPLTATERRKAQILWDDAAPPDA